MHVSMLWRGGEEAITPCLRSLLPSSIQRGDLPHRGAPPLTGIHDDDESCHAAQHHKKGNRECSTRLPALESQDPPHHRKTVEDELECEDQRERLACQRSARDQHENEGNERQPAKEFTTHKLPAAPASEC